MGWYESPYFFCAASETARDVIEALLQEVSLTDPPFDNRMLDTLQDYTIHLLTDAAPFINILEVSVDDFIGMTNNSAQDHLRHFTRTIIIGIHSVLSPPEVYDHQGQEPISEKNLDQGEGKWETAA